MRKRDHNIFANAASLLVCGVLAGVVVAAAAFPAVAMGGLSIKAGADGFGELPTSLKVPSPPQITYVYASDGKTLLTTFYDENRHNIPLSEMPLVIQRAIIAAEDNRFYEHKGVDMQGILRAFVSNKSGGDTQGASTLTQQYVKQAQTYSATTPAEVIAATEQTNARKLREARLALALETVLTKDEILERYLNIAAFGHGAYGIYAATQVYFSKEPKDLTLPEAALLAALPKAPSKYDPVDPDGRKEALIRRTYVLKQMVTLGYITQDEADKADKVEVVVTGNRTPNGCIATTVDHWGFFCDYFYRWWISQETFGKDEAERGARLKSGGYRIVTTMDLVIQDSAKKNVEKELPTGNRDALMVAAIEPGSGRVKALAANRNYGLDTRGNQPSTDPKKAAAGIKGTFPTTTNPILTGGGDISGYKAGSTFKMFTMLAALDAGYPLDYQIVAKQPYQSKYGGDKNEKDSLCPDGIHWCPKNASASMSGPKNMWTGFGGSVNTYFVPLQERIGADKAIDMANKAGIRYRNQKDIDFTTRDPVMAGPFTLGINDTVPLDLANSYATVAADGLHCEPTPVVEAFNKDGVKLEGVGNPNCQQVIRPEVARAAADAARCPIRDGGGLHKCAGAATTGTYFSAGSIAATIKHPVIGKTGTSDYNWTANLVLSTKQLAVAATGADPDFAQVKHNDAFPQKINRAAAHTLRDGMANLPVIDFEKPPTELVVGKKVSFPNYSCKSVAAAKSGLEALKLSVSIESQKIDSPCPEGTVAKTDPEGTASANSQVSIYVSTGKPPSGPGDSAGSPGPPGPR